MLHAQAATGASHDPTQRLVQRTVRTLTVVQESKIAKAERPDKVENLWPWQSLRSVKWLGTIPALYEPSQHLKVSCNEACEISLGSGDNLVFAPQLFSGEVGKKCVSSSCPRVASEVASSCASGPVLMSFSETFCVSIASTLSSKRPSSAAPSLKHSEIRLNPELEEWFRGSLRTIPAPH
jgi:hypothetical protein